MRVWLLVAILVVLAVSVEGARVVRRMAPATPAKASRTPAVVTKAATPASPSASQPLQPAAKPKPKVGRQPEAKRGILKTVRKLATIRGISMEEKEYQRQFSDFMRKHHRVYKAEDMKKRYDQYKMNCKFIQKWNKEHPKRLTFTLASNQFSDHSSKEFQKRLGFRSARLFAPEALKKNAQTVSGISLTVPKTSATPAAAADLGVGPVTAPPRFKTMPASKNWADDPEVVSPVRMQGTCGSCWAFATASAVESAYAILTGKLHVTSPQHLLDCCSGEAWYPCDGCNGGDYMTAYRFVASKGLCAGDKYPYTGVASGSCKPCQSVAFASGGAIVARNGDEVSLLAAVNRAPVATAVMAQLPTFQFYAKGVYNDLACPKDFNSLDHAVVLTGYGSTPDGLDYWWLRNTWGPTWGEKGYMRLARGVNACGVALEATQPVAMLDPNSPDGQNKAGPTPAVPSVPSVPIWPSAPNAQTPDVPPVVPTPDVPFDGFWEPTPPTPEPEMDYGF